MIGKYYQMTKRLKGYQYIFMHCIFFIFMHSYNFRT